METEIGIVKWYGGLNRKTGKQNDYGFIERYDGSDVFVHKSGLICNDNELSEGRIIVFDLISGKRGNEAKNVKIYNTTISEEEITDHLVSSAIGWMKKEISAINHFSERILWGMIRHPQIQNKLLILIHLFQRNPTDEIVYQIKEYIQNNPQLYKALPTQIKDHRLMVDMLPIKEQLKIKITVYQDISDETFEQIADILKSDPNWIKELPSEVKQHPMIFSMLDTKQQLLTRLYDYHDSSDEILKEVSKILQEEPIWFNYLPDNIQKDFRLQSAIKPVLGQILDSLKTSSSQLNLFSSIYKNFPIDEDLIELTARFIPFVQGLIEILPESFKNQKYILHAITPKDQVDMTWPPSNPNFWNSWGNMSWQAQVLCVYRAAYENINLYQYILELNIVQLHPLVESALIILSHKYKLTSQDDTIRKYTDLIYEYLGVIIWESKSEDIIDLRPLLPNCYLGIVCHCEGRMWLKAPNGAFCPRRDRSIGKVCDFPIIK